MDGLVDGDADGRLAVDGGDDIAGDDAGLVGGGVFKGAGDGEFAGDHFDLVADAAEFPLPCF